MTTRADPSLPEDLSEVLAVARGAYPREGCGVVLVGANGHRVVALTNAAEDPRQHFAFDDQAWLRTLREAEARGEVLSCIFHSHPDAPATLSAEDVRRAAPGGVPLFPGVTYMVVSLYRSGRIDARLHRWSDTFFAEVARLETAP